MLFLARTFCFSRLAFPNRGAFCSVSRPFLDSLATGTRLSSRRLVIAVDMSTFTDLGGGGDGGVVRPLVPVSSITAFGKGLGQEELQVGGCCLPRSFVVCLVPAFYTAAVTPTAFISLADYSSTDITC